MRKLFLIAVVFGSIVCTSCDPQPISEEFKVQATEGEDGEIGGGEGEDHQGLRNPFSDLFMMKKRFPLLLPPPPLIVRKPLRVRLWWMVKSN